jgi:hypothetical protein
VITTRYVLGDRVALCRAKGTIVRILPAWDSCDYAVKVDMANGTEYVEEGTLEPLAEPRDMRAVRLWGSPALGAD